MPKLPDPDNRKRWVLCGRYSIYSAMDDYLRHLASDRAVINGYNHEWINRYNVTPSTRVELITQTVTSLRADRVEGWGWRFLSEGKRPDPINTGPRR